MNQQVIRIIHIIQDDKFLDGVMRAFESDNRYENHYFYICKTKNYAFKWVKNTEKIKLLYSPEMIKEVFQKFEYDAIFFSCLLDYKVFKYIPDDKIVIWWSWGFDIYGPDRFINVSSYKPITDSYLKQKRRGLTQFLKTFVQKIPFLVNLKYGNKYKAMRRVDYFQPVISSEYQLMRQIKGFHAKEFYYPGANSFKSYIMPELPKHTNRLILGNSATPTNNHCDVWQNIKAYIPNDLNVVIPVSYGDKNYSTYIENKIEGSNISFLKEFMPYNDYMDLLDSCSFAVYGVLRQQAMGAIYRCVACGIKLFLYRDSIVYNYLTSLGCIVFAIEDINADSFTNPLTIEQAEQNRDCLVKERDKIDKIRESSIEEIQKKIVG